MRKSNHHLLRQALRNMPDGAIVSHLSRLVEVPRSGVLEALKKMPDAYIDRWTDRTGGGLAAVWCVAHVPEHCPKPDRVRSHAPEVRDVQEVA